MNTESNPRNILSESRKSILYFYDREIPIIVFICVLEWDQFLIDQKNPSCGKGPKKCRKTKISEVQKQIGIEQY